MKWAIYAGVLAFCCMARAADWVARLESSDIQVRREAVDRIQTLEDARIPEACLCRY